MATRTISNAGGNWDATGSWVEGVVPTNADNVVATATSGNLTINAAAACRSIDLTGYVGTLTHNTSITLTIGDATGGALKFVAGMTYTPVSSFTSAIHFVSTSTNSGQGWSITTAGKTLAAVTFNGAAGMWKLQDALTLTSALTFTTGTLNTNGQSVTATSFSSNNTNARTLTMGSSSMTFTAALSTAWLFQYTNLTVTANSAHVLFTGGAGNLMLAKDWNGMSITITGSGLTICSVTGCVLRNLTVAPASASPSQTSFDADVTVADTLTITGFSGASHVDIVSSSAGVNRNLNYSYLVDTDVDYVDVTPVQLSFTRTISNAGGNWNAAAAWVEGLPPLSFNDVVATATSGNLTVNVDAACRSIDLTGYTGTLTHSANVTLSVGDASGGMLKFVAGMTYAAFDNPPSVIAFVSTADNGGAGWPITLGGKQLKRASFDGVGGKWTLQDTFRAVEEFV